MIAAGHRRLKAQNAQVCNRLPTLDGTDGGHSSDFADFDAVTVNVRNRGVIGDAQKHPTFQNALQFFPAALHGLGIGPGAGNGRYFALERTIVLDNFVPGLAHGRPNIRSEHRPIIPLRLVREAASLMPPRSVPSPRQRQPWRLHEVPQSRRTFEPSPFLHLPHPQRSGLHGA